ncbi:MAG TPA: DUF1616 domain-containing protein [Ktedonobacteraceae bacterium]|nr:DUF1616 domain-containing protein [Ktedonobacteraceae bacterium]
MMKQRYLDIFIVIGIALADIALALLVPPTGNLLRVLTLPLVLILPGYALTSALFSQKTLNAIERLVLSLGLSLVCAIVCGLLLNLTPFGLQADSWAVLSGSITLVACAIALIQRFQGGLRADESAPRGLAFTFGQGLLLGLAALILCGGVVVSTIGAQQQPRPGFTQLWILPGSGVSAKSAVRIGMRNMEQTAMQYRLVVNEDGKIVKQWPLITLASGQNWQVTLALPQAQHTDTSTVEAMLYRVDMPAAPYRHVMLWLH